MHEKLDRMAASFGDITVSLNNLDHRVHNINDRLVSIEQSMNLSSPGLDSYAPPPSKPLDASCDPPSMDWDIATSDIRRANASLDAAARRNRQRVTTGSSTIVHDPAEGFGEWDSAFTTPLNTLTQDELIEKCQDLKSNLDYAYEQNANAQQELDQVKNEVSGWKHEIVQLQNQIRMLTSAQISQNEQC